MGDPSNIIVHHEYKSCFPLMLKDERKNAIFVDPGGGINKSTHEFSFVALLCGRPIVLDSDVLIVFATGSKNFVHDNHQCWSSN